MKGILKTLLFFLIFFGGIGIVGATPTLNVPTASQNITGAVTANCTSVATFTNATLQYDNSGWTDISTNATEGIQWNFALTEASVVDGAYTMRCYANATGLNASASPNVTLVGFDDTAPTITWTALVDATKGNAETISGTCLDADFSNEACSSCTYYQVPDSSNLGDCLTGCATSFTGTAMSYTYTPDVYGIKNSYIECTDQHSQSVNTSQSLITIHSRGSGTPTTWGKLETVTGQQTKSQQTRNFGMFLLFGFVAVALIVVAYLVVNQPKNKPKRQKRKK